MYKIFLIIALCVQQSFQMSNLGALELDEISFDKVKSKFKYSLIKFDVAFPYGDKHEAFLELAREAKDVDDVLIAEVGIKDYGQKENQVLASRYGIEKDHFPAVRLFVEGQEDPIAYKSEVFTTESMREFVSTNTGMYLTLPGCLKKLDQLAFKFMSAPSDKREKIMAAIDEAATDMNETDQATAKVYKVIMKKIAEKGSDVIETEIERVKKLIMGKVTEEKKKKLQQNLNVLKTFNFKNNELLKKKSEL